MSLEIIKLSGCLITDADAALLLLLRTSNQEWELPGGKIEDGETSPDAAIREADEELGVGVVITKSYKGIPFVGNEGQDYVYDWHEAYIIDGKKPYVAEPNVHEDLAYFNRSRLIQAEAASVLSPNVTNLVRALIKGEVQLVPRSLE